MKLEVMSIEDVAAFQLCCGCGACAYIRPEQIQMADMLDHGRRPVVRGGGCSDREVMQVCPGIALEHRFDRTAPGLIAELLPGWGPILAVWEGHASDERIRHSGSSGGVATALALYAVETDGMHGVLHVAARQDRPYLNETVMSRTRIELLARTGSRYAPASPCDGLQMIEDAPGRCVFIGKPCDVAAVEEARRLRPALDHRIGLTIAVFCAGTPTTRGTLEMLRRMGIDDPDTVVELRYRGNGWPGHVAVTFRTAEGLETRTLTYEQSWGEILSGYAQWRCRLCPDHTGEFADIAVGDPWYRPIPPGEPGRSLVLARTQRGRDFLLSAIQAGYLQLKQVSATVLPASQPGLLRVRASVWGRLLTLRLLGLAIPRFRGFPMFVHWVHKLTTAGKLKSLLGTLLRARRRRLRERQIMITVKPKSTSLV